MSGLLDTHQTSGQRASRVMAPSRRAMQELPETHIGTLSPRGDRYGCAFLPACLGDGPHLGAAGAMDPGRNAARGRDDRHRPPRDPTQCLGHRDRHRRIGPWRLRSALPPLGPPGRYGRWARPRAPRVRGRVRAHELRALAVSFVPGATLLGWSGPLGAAAGLALGISGYAASAAGMALLARRRSQPDPAELLGEPPGPARVPIGALVATASMAGVLIGASLHGR